MRGLTPDGSYMPRVPPVASCWEGRPPELAPPFFERNIFLKFFIAKADCDVACGLRKLTRTIRVANNWQQSSQ